MIIKNEENLIRQDSLGGLAYKKIKEFILKGILKPGDKVMQEKMAMELGISKIPLIQALTLLEKEGLISKVPQKGFFIRDISKGEIIKIFDVRYIFEEIGVKSLVKNLNNENMKKLDKYLKDFKKYYQNNNKADYILLDADFHRFLIESSGNEVIIKIVDSFNIFVLTFLRGILNLKESYFDHCNIIQAILEKDIEKTLLALEKHLNKVKNTVF